jgi:YVTN family beta-propeller protein
MNRREVLRAGAALPAALAFGPSARAQQRREEGAPRAVFVVNTGDGTVSLVDLATLREVRRLTVGPRPYGVVVSQDGNTVAVGVEDEERVKFFEAATGRLKGECRIGPMYNDHIILTQDGRHLLVANFHSDDVVGVEVETMREAFRISGGSAPHVVKYGPLKRHVYVTCKKITGIAVIDPQERKLVRFHQMNVNPRSLTFSPDESKLYFGSFWVNGFFEMDPRSGKVTRLFELEPPADDRAAREVTYHGVEAVGANVVLAANEGRSYVDAVNASTGERLDRLTAGVSQPCCVERIPGPSGTGARVLISNLGDGTLQLAEVSREGRLKSLGKAAVGKAPKRVAFLPVR